MHDRIIKPYGDPDLKLEALSLWVLEGEDPESDHWSDGNWLTVFARVEASGAYVWVHGPCLTSDELAGFLEQLERMIAISGVPPYLIAPSHISARR
jgi:hypothetical protein